jgi:hypothetical protein
LPPGVYQGRVTAHNRTRDRPTQGRADPAGSASRAIAKQIHWHRQ